MIDPQTETLILLTDAPKHIPNRPTISAVWRWRSRGVHGIKLETILIGGRRNTSLEALVRFFERSTAAADGGPVTAETPGQRQRAIERAEKRAASLGV